MNCSSCGKSPAKIYERRTSEGKVRIVLCADCYRKLYVETSEPGLFTQFVQRKVKRTREQCPNCSTSLADFRKTGLVGCAQCYEFFREDLIPTVRYIQWDIQHEGKTPSADTEKCDLISDLKMDLEKVRKQFEEAAQSEDYALVGRLNEQLVRIARRLKELEEEE